MLSIFPLACLVFLVHYIFLFLDKNQNLLNYKAFESNKESHAFVNPFSAGTAFMLMQTGWIQASRQVTRWLS